MIPSRPDCNRMIYTKRGFWILLGLMGTAIFLALSPSVSFSQEMLRVSGITESIKDVTLSLSVAGTIETIYIKEGDYIAKGRTILELDKRLEQLETERRKLIWDSKAEVESSLEQVTTLKSLLEATRRLFNSTKSVSREELEKRELEFKLAVAELKRLEVEEQRQRIEYKMAVENLRKRSLVSPISGIVIKLFLEKGESAQPQQPLVQVMDRSKCLWVSNIEEKVGRSLRQGHSVDLEIRAGDGFLKKKGTIIFISPAVDPASGLMEVKVRFDNKNGDVRPGVSGVMLIKAP